LVEGVNTSTEVPSNGRPSSTHVNDEHCGRSSARSHLEVKTMNSSAKLTTVLLAAAALGAAVSVFGGCTVDSTTNTDTDGGSSGTSGTSGTSGSTSGTSGTSGGGTDAGACPGNKQKEALGEDACQACLEQKCCTQLKGCFNLPPVDASTQLDCDGYATCIFDCSKEQDPKGCEDTECQTTGAPGVSDGYDAIEACGRTNCKTECAFPAEDGGT
jgi:hypothetical protein